ncbi:MAG TPA: 5'-3' exonuclease H3TH domain-containing protein [Polyangiaceae bacterium]|nr:5'-3' exonuclease H3TH domain-containing protein [Polyangiaceae bacterium]
MKKLILIDLSGLFWASWHATADMELSAAFERTVSKVHALRDGYDLCAVCVDAPPYHRKKLSAEYKSQRDAPPPQAVEQFQRVKERLEADGLLLWSAKGYEADDVIATAVGFAARDGLFTTIASSDKDLYCLIDDRFASLLTLNGGNLMNEAACREKFQVAPLLIPELLALMGDTSDNVPGVPGVGIKNAAKLLEKYGPTVDDVIANAPNIENDRMRGLVLSNVEAIRLARQLVHLHTDVPLDWDALYVERKPKPLTRGRAADWTDADFTEDEPVPAQAEQQSEPEQEEKSDPRQPPPEDAISEAPRAKALAIVKPAEWSLALEPPNAQGAWIVANKLHNSRLFGNFGSPEAVFAIIIRGRALGLDAGTALASFHVVEGKPTMHAGLIIGLVLKSGKAEYFDLVETSSTAATWATKRRGARHETKLTWTIEDACAAGLVERSSNGTFRGVSRSGKPSNWDKYRRTMLRWRAGVELARAVYPDVTMGLYTPDEASDGQSDILEGELEVA